jgi:3-dehydroquinate synthase
VEINSFINSAEALSSLLESIDNKVILCDHNTYTYCFSKLKLDSEVPLIIVEEGEESKSMKSLEVLLEKLTIIKCDRKTTLINLGGGVITDLGGFAASIYKRGIPFINIPTSLMAMVDAANGGKTGINFLGNKNYLGTFTKPKSVWIWPGFIKTLNQKEILSGFAEMLKHGLIADPVYFKTLAQLNLKEDIVSDIDWRPLIEKSVEIKSEITNRDFKESGDRKLLNFGHTVGHALESFFMDNHTSHGYYVAAGMICEAWLSKTLGDLTESEFEEIVQTVDRFFERFKLSENQKIEIAELVINDKKSTSKTIQCVFLNHIGSAEFDKPITPQDVIESFNYYSPN